MKKMFVIVSFTCFSISVIGQANTFQFTCGGIVFTASYVRSQGNEKTLEISWNENRTIALTNAESTTALLPANATLTKQFAMNLIRSHEGLNYADAAITNFLYPVPATRTTLTYDLAHKFTKANILNITSSTVIQEIHSALQSQTQIQRGAVALCNPTELSNFINAGIAGLAGVSPNNDNKRNNYSNAQIIRNPQMKNSDFLKENPALKQNNDIRNPITFTKFLVRNPAINGKGITIIPTNNASYHYIRPGSIVNILFIKEIYELLNTDITIKAYIKKKDESIVPVGVGGFYDVKLETNQTNFEKNKQDDKTLTYAYSMDRYYGAPIQTEINTTNVKVEAEDKLYVSIINVSDGGVSFTTVFEYEDFGWTSQASGGFAWINPINTGSHEFVPAGSAGYSFYFKVNKGAPFWKKFFIPSFGPELNVLQGQDNKTMVGLGGSLSVFLRTVKVGYGWFLSGNNGKPYVSLGVNFIEGFQTISSVLNNIKNPSQTP